MADWLNLIKDKIKDAAAYSMVAEQVSMLEERIRLRDDQIRAPLKIAHFLQFSSKVLFPPEAFYGTTSSA